MSDVVGPGDDMVTNRTVGDVCAGGTSVVANSALSGDNAGCSGGTSVVANGVGSGSNAGCASGTCVVSNVTVSGTNSG